MFRKRSKHDHLRMNVAPDQTIVLGPQIVLDHRSLSSIDQKILMTPPPHLPMSPFLILVGHWRSSSESYSSSFVLLSFSLSAFCLSVSISMLYLSKVPIDGAHVTDICCIT